MFSRLEIAARKEGIRREVASRWLAHVARIAATAEAVAKLGAVAAASDERRELYLRRESRKPADRFRGLGLERMIGPTLDLDDLPPTEDGLDAGTPVGRIVELLDGKRIGEGFATGFLVSGGLLITNWHVFAQAGDASGCAAHLGFQRSQNGLLDQGSVFELDPAGFFYSNRELDIALVAVRTRALIGADALESYGFTRLIPSVGKILAGQPVSIIQHPDGGHKRWAVRENKLLREPTGADDFLEYTTDTLPGSSGAPAFNKDWELVAVHHSGVPRMQGGEILLRTGGFWRPGIPDRDIDWIANEGVRVSKVHAHLAELAQRDPARKARLAMLMASSKDPAAPGEMRSASGLTTAPVGNVSVASRFTNEGMPMNIVVNGTAHFHFAPEKVAPVGARTGEGAPEPATGADARTAATLPFAEKKLRFDPDYDARPGYDETFLPGFVVPPPKAPLDEVLKHGNGQKVLRYHHYSLVMHKERRLCMWAASNVDYDESKRRRSREEFGTDTWKLDPRILGERQIEDTELYDPAKKFDRGHIVRRDDVAWGETAEEEEFGNSDSFHFTNCTPQHEQFNRAVFQFKGLWGELENHIARQAGFLQNMLCVFAGPVLAPDDPARDFGFGTQVQVPIQYWKVIMAVEDSNTNPRLRAYGFLLSQQDAIDKYGWENRFRAGRFREQQVSLGRITAESRVAFAQALLDADPLALEPNESAGRRLESLADVSLR